MKKLLIKFIFGIVIFLVVIFFLNVIFLKNPESSLLSNVEMIQKEEFTRTEEKFIENLSKSIRYKTISYQDLKRDEKEYEAFKSFIQTTFPTVSKNLNLIFINRFTFLFEWKGSNPDLLPAIIMGHYDVVPVNEKEWEFPPFEGIIKDNYMYGRGTIDDKITVIGVLQAAEFLLQNQFRPQRTIYFSFGHDEEIGGIEGAKAVVEYLEEKKIRPIFVFDEGGAITVKMVPGVSKPVALIGIAEKGYVSLELIATGKGGHSSIPSRETAVTKLIEALHKLNQNPFPLDISTVQKQMLTFLAPEFPFVQKLVIANLFFLEPIVVNILSSTDSGRASMHTTMTPTILQAGIKENIIPSEAKAILNFRILPGQSVEDIKKKIKEIVGEDIQIKELPFASEPSPVSKIEGDDAIGFTIMAKTLKTIDSNILYAPYLVLGATDSRYFSKITENIYRFIPIYLTDDDMKRMHGNNERISIESIKVALKFYTLFLSNL